jgi:hypothetical protein
MAWWYIGLICAFPTLKLPLDFCRAGATLGRSTSSSGTGGSIAQAETAVVPIL